MKNKRHWKILGVLVMALAMVWATTIVLAGPPTQGPSSENNVSDPTKLPPPQKTLQVIGDDPDEDGYSGLVPSSVASIAIPSETGAGNVPSGQPIHLGPQPDEDGYEGPVPLNVESGIAPSEPDTSLAPDWDQFFVEPQPDQDEYYLSNADISNAGFSATFSYLYVAGTALRPRNSSTAWTYGGTGCVYSSSGGGLFNIHLDIPEGSRIDFLRIYYYDTSAIDTIAYITSYDGMGGFADLISVSSSGNSGYGTQLSSLLGHTPDYASNSYVLNWIPSQAGNTMQLCGLRVAYRLPT